MGYIVRSGDMSRFKLNEADTVASVLQNIAILLSTRQGSVPLYRGFGLPMRFIDKPMEIAKTMLAAEVLDALREYEPRAEVLDITFDEDAEHSGRLIPKVEVEIHEEPRI